jgi:hypothetical protein
MVRVSWVNQIDGSAQLSTPGPFDRFHAHDVDPHRRAEPCAKLRFQLSLHRFREFAEHYDLDPDVVRQVLHYASLLQR